MKCLLINSPSQRVKSDTVFGCDRDKTWIPYSSRTSQRLFMETLSVEAKITNCFLCFSSEHSNSTAVLLHWSSPNIHRPQKPFRGVHDEVISALSTLAVKSGARGGYKCYALLRISGAYFTHGVRQKSTVPLLLTYNFYSFINQEVLESCMNHKGTEKHQNNIY